MTMTISGTDGLTFPDSTAQYSGSYFSFKNRIINGDMRIDQRNAGAAVTVSANSSAWIADRFRCDSPNDQSMTFQQQTTTVPTGFNYSLKVTAGTGTSNAANAPALLHFVEGYNVADFGFGTANAKTFTFSFWVYSSLTGTFGVCFENNAGNRTYVTSYTINSANTWEQKTITLAGDTSGTWPATNTRGISIIFDLGVGTTNSVAASSSWADLGGKRGLTGGTKICQTTGATWYITGVQLEVGSVATPFERRPYGTELMLCQRYFFKLNSTYTGGGFAGTEISSTNALAYYKYPVDMRANPTVTQTGTVRISSGTTSSDKTSITSTDAKLSYMRMLWDVTGAGLTSGYACHMDFVSGAVQEITVSAEL